MRVLVTGGTGVIGNGLIPALLERGHAVSLLSRGANTDAMQWDGVDAVAGDVTDAASLRGAADECDVVVHIAGIVAETPDATFEGVNVNGTRHMLAEAERARVKRFVFMSSLGADRGSSAYHRSKREAEEVVRRASIPWTIVRPGNVYGTGDEVVSLILKLVRTAPAVPVVDNGDQQFQPVYFEDLGRFVAAVLTRDDVDGTTLEVAGDDITSMRDLLDRLRTITDRKPLRVPVPMPLATFVARLAGFATPGTTIDENKLKMLLEDNVLHGENAAHRFGISLTSLQDGLRKLADRLPEQLPEAGVGSMEEKRFWADIHGAPCNAAATMRMFRDRITEIMPVEFAAEPGAPTRLEPGATLTGSLPLRGHFQVRVERVDPHRVVLATIEGHPLAGTVEFFAEDVDSALRFTIFIHTRSANLFDFIAAKTIGKVAQNANWREVVKRVVELSGGTSEKVEEAHRRLDESEAADWESSIRALVQARMRSSVRGS